MVEKYLQVVALLRNPTNLKFVQKIQYITVIHTNNTNVLICDLLDSEATTIPCRAEVLNIGQVN